MQFASIFHSAAARCIHREDEHGAGDEAGIRSIGFGLAVIVMISFSLTLSGLLKDHAVTVSTPTDTPGQSGVVHHVHGLLPS
jgi:hypothetical protein